MLYDKYKIHLKYDHYQSQFIRTHNRVPLFQKVEIFK